MNAVYIRIAIKAPINHRHALHLQTVLEIRRLIELSELIVLCHHLTSVYVLYSNDETRPPNQACSGHEWFHTGPWSSAKQHGLPHVLFGCEQTISLQAFWHLRGAFPAIVASALSAEFKHVAMSASIIIKLTTINTMRLPLPSLLRTGNFTMSDGSIPSVVCTMMCKSPGVATE